MTLINVNARTGSNRLVIRLFDEQGRMSKRAERQLSNFLRCHHTGRTRGIHWRLLRNVYLVARHFGKPLYVYSGYRHKTVAKRRGSYHIKGRAIDFRVAGVSTRKLRDYLMKRFSGVGVGYYPSTPFIHFDVRDGKRSAFWIDFSGPGEKSRYAKDPHGLLALERRGIAIREGLGEVDVPGAVAAAAAKIDQGRSATTTLVSSMAASSSAGGRESVGPRDHVPATAVTGPAPLGPNPSSVDGD